MIDQSPLGELQGSINSSPTVIASLRSVLTGQLLPITTPISCRTCGDKLQAGSRIVVEQATPLQHISWQSTRWCCLACGLTAVHLPRRPIYRVLATVGMRSFVSQQEHRACLNNPVVLSTNVALADTPDCHPESALPVHSTGIDTHKQCLSVGASPHNSATTCADSQTND